MTNTYGVIGNTNYRKKTNIFAYFFPSLISFEIFNINIIYMFSDKKQTLLLASKPFNLCF